MLEVHEILGAGPPAGTVQITLFVPSVDRDGAEIDQGHWREEALGVMGLLFRGATAFPPGRGVWRDDASGGALVFDDTVLITSYVSEDIFTERSLRELRTLLHRLGRDAKQGEVGVVISGSYYGITDFDGPSSDEPGGQS